MNTYQQWDLFYLNHEQRLKEAEQMRLSRLFDTQPSWLSKLATTLRRRLAMQHRPQPNAPSSLKLAEPE